jgi:NosR/NirI family transcriptional regulator, nitrite reductase regulator
VSSVRARRLIHIKPVTANAAVHAYMQIGTLQTSWRSAIAMALALVVPHLASRAAPAADYSIAAEFFPGERISIGNVSGSPPASTLKAADGQVVGAVTGSVGYSGRPIDIIAAVTPDGIVAGARIVAHEEPILVIGIPREAIAAYVANFKGFDVRVGGTLNTTGSPRGAPQAVAGASVTSAVIRDAIVRSARAVLRSRVMPGVEHARIDRESRRRSSWNTLVAENAVRNLLITRAEAARLLGTHDDEPDKTFIDLWLVVATPSAIGESLLGRQVYERESARIGADDNLLLIAANGLYSFRGTGWPRSGVFDRVQIVQGGKTIRLRAADHERIDTLRAAGSPEFREIGLFRLAQSTGFDPVAPFRLDIDLARGAASPQQVANPAVVSLEYRIPDAYLIQPASTPRTPHRVDEIASALDEPTLQAPLWQDIWWRRRHEIAVLGIMLGGLGVILVFQNWVTSRTAWYRRTRIAYLLITLGFLGFFANAQLSVVNVVTFIHALLSGFRWELFLLDPLVFVLWSFVAVSMLFWGRGVFCGWLCPFGALQELINEAARRIGLRQITVPFGLHERLWMIKYVIFLGILALSLNSIMDAFGMAELEPFKTAITLKFIRDWPLVLYAAALLAVGLFIERFYCRYLCPLGAALAIPARMRMFEWLKRYRECGGECQVCARTCTVQAIHPLGQINPNECIYCLKCQANYLDAAVCLHIKKRIERRQPQVVPPAVSQAALPRKDRIDAR